MQIGEGYLTEPVTIEYPTDNSQTAFMNYYPPKNQDYQLPPGDTPPLLVKIHGGPTSQASTAFNLGYQYWTSRGNKTLSCHTNAAFWLRARFSYQGCLLQPLQ